MQVRKLLVALSLGFCACPTGRAQLPGLDVFEIGDIRRIALADTGSGVVANVLVAFRNTGKLDLKVRQGDFRIFVVPKEGERILVGTSHVDEMHLPATKEQQAAEVAQELTLVLGTDRAEILQRLSAFVLAVVNSKDQLKVLLEGSCEMGIKLGRTWQFAKGISFEFDMDQQMNWDVLWDKTAKGGVTISFGEQ